MGRLDAGSTGRAATRRGPSERAAGGAAVHPPRDERSDDPSSAPRARARADRWWWRGMWSAAVLAGLSAWHAVAQRPSDVRSYHQWIRGPVPSWSVPGPYPLGADLVWWPLRAFAGTSNNLWWLLGWTGPATLVACLLLWRTCARPAAAVTVWLGAAAILERSYWMRLEPLAAVCALAMVLGVRRGRVRGSALALSAGALIKVWPGFLLPMALLELPDRARRRWLAWFAGPWLVYLIAVLVLRPPGGSTWFTFTLTRRTQAESLSALPALWAIVAGSHHWRVVYVAGLDSADLVLGPDLRIAHLALEGAALVVLAVLALRARRWLRSGGAPTVELVSHLQTAVLVLVVFAGPVFSPQYLVWFAPVLVVAFGAGLMGPEVAIWLAGCALTTLEFPFLWDEIRRPHAFAVGVLTLRDLVLLVLLVRSLRQVSRLTAIPTG